MNIAEISRAVGTPHTTLQCYLALLEATFLRLHPNLQMLLWRGLSRLI